MLSLYACVLVGVCVQACVCGIFRILDCFGGWLCGRVWYDVCCRMFDRVETCGGIVSLRLGRASSFVRAFYSSG